MHPNFLKANIVCLAFFYLLCIKIIDQDILAKTFLTFFDVFKSLLTGCFIYIDLLPNFVYKVDDDNLEDEFMEFLEDFGLEEVNGGEAAEQLIESVKVTEKKELKKYFSQLDESTLNDLVHFYRIDLEMFGYLDMTKFL